MQIFAATVVAARILTPGMIRITLGGQGMAGFTSTGVGDEYLRVFLPGPGASAPVLPFATADSWDYHPGQTPSPMRTYTVRGVDPHHGTADIDFVMHDGGVAAEWAKGARPGDVVGLNSPTGLYDPPADITWQVLMADATGLPAAARLAEQAPAGVRTRVVIEVLDPTHRQEIACGPHVEVAWVYGGNGSSQSQLDALIRSIDLPTGSGYVWFAGETKVLRSVRRHLRHERRFAPNRYKLIGYWTDKSEQWAERYDSLDTVTRQWLDELWQDDQADPEELEDLYAAKLESLGL